MSAKTEQTQTRERGILFSDRLVRAILDGRKTQTRRIVKTRPENHTRVGPVCHQAHIASPEALAHCPYGVPGDRLYVREAFSLDHSGHVSHRGVLYRATALTDRSHHGPWATRQEDGTWLDFYDRPFTWKPSIHMPKWAARIWLEITGVRVERVQEISQDDAIAEGVPCDLIREWADGSRTNEGPFGPAAVMAFAHLWDQTNAHRPGCTWEDNPWVWVLEFRRVEVGHG